MTRWGGIFVALALLANPAAADEEQGVFEPGDHCVAYRTIKDMLFASNVVVVGKSCEVTATLESSEGDVGPRVVVEVPIESFRSGNFLRDGAVSDILDAELQPNLRFATEPLDVDAVRQGIEAGSFPVSGQLAIAGVEHAVSSPVEVADFDGRRFVRGQLSTTFTGFGMEPPTAAAGIIAKVHEDLDLLVQLDLAKIEGLSGLETAPAL